MRELSDFEVCETCSLLRREIERLESIGLFEKAGELKKTYCSLLYGHVYVKPYNS